MLARTTVPVAAEQVDREVVIAFESGDIGKPIVLGVLRLADGQGHAEAAGRAPDGPTTDRPGDPGRRATGPHRRERDRPPLRQGEPHATRAGKVLIRGTYLLSRSSGVNRIKGGSVQIN